MHAKFGLPLPEFKHTDLPNYHRFHIDGESEEEFSARMAANFEQLILAEGPETVAAFFCRTGHFWRWGAHAARRLLERDAGRSAQV